MYSASMAIRKKSFAPGEYYHLYNRGNGKREIFHDTEDYSRFVGLLYACNQKNNFKIDDLKKDQGLFNIDVDGSLISIGAYCLMPNHFHLLVAQGQEGNISKYVQKMSTAYVMYYNKKYRRTGSLFEGAFKAEHVDTDEYLRYLFSYIHLNPMKLIDRLWKEKDEKDIRAKQTYILEYQYSSAQEYIRQDRVQKKILHTEDFPNYFLNTKDFVSEITSWFSARSDLAEE